MAVTLYEILWPAKHVPLAMTYSLPGVTLSGPPKSRVTDGTVLKLVCSVAGLDSRATSNPPEPLRLKADVVSLSCWGSRKTSVQVLPESDWGMSKLKIEEMVEEMVPL